MIPCLQYPGPSIPRHLAKTAPSLAFVSFSGHCGSVSTCLSFFPTFSQTWSHEEQCPGWGILCLSPLDKGQLAYPPCLLGNSVTSSTLRPVQVGPLPRSRALECFAQKILNLSSVLGTAGACSVVWSPKPGVPFLSFEDLSKPLPSASPQPHTCRVDQIPQGALVSHIWDCLGTLGLQFQEGTWQGDCSH